MINLLSKNYLTRENFLCKLQGANKWLHWMILALGLLFIALFIYFVGTLKSTPHISQPVQIDHTIIAVTQFGESIKLLITLTLGVFAVVAFLLKDIWTQKDSLPVLSRIFLCMFLLLSSLSLYYGVHARFEVVVQIEQGFFKYGKLRKLVYWQSCFLLLAALTALLILWHQLTPGVKGSAVDK